MKYDQDLCLNFDLQKLLWQDELNPRVRCAFGNVSVFVSAVSTKVLYKFEQFVFIFLFVFVFVSAASRKVLYKIEQSRGAGSLTHTAHISVKQDFLPPRI